MNSRLAPGDGSLTVSLDNRSDAHFSSIQFSYPLKLIVPKRRFLPGVQAVYVLSYGGGLVAGDRVRLKGEVERGATLVMLTQGGEALPTPTSAGRRKCRLSCSSHFRSIR